MRTRKMVVLSAYKNRGGADHTVNELTSGGFETAEISILLPHDRGIATVENAKDREPKNIPDKMTELTFKETKDISFGRSEDIAAKNTKIPQGAGTGAGIGAPFGGTLFGAFAGATAGGAVGVLVGLGIPEDEAKLYEERLKKGGILLSVHTESGARTNQARTILKNTGATDVAATREVTGEPSATQGIPRAAGR